MNDFPQPKIAQGFLRGKVNVPTGKWDELKQGEHSHCFTVAHSTLGNVLDDIHGMLDKAMAEGQDFQSWRREFAAKMQAKGWYGRADKGPDDKGYMNWRAELIFHTNMRTAYSAQGYRQQMEIADMRPLWQYNSALVGNNRRQEHLALHGKAFRYDDPFWNANYPPNGWGCDCKVLSLSESGAKRDGVEVLSSAPDGNPPPMADGGGKPIDWGKFTPETWRYNPGKDALAPNFAKYENLKKDAYRMADGRTALRHIKDSYQKAMEATKMQPNEFKGFISRLEKSEKEIKDVNYQVGNLEGDYFEKMENEAKVDDSKVMGTDRAIHHGVVHKNDGQKIPKEYFDDLYELLQRPQMIYEKRKPDNPKLGREFHFVKDTRDGQKIKVVLRKLENAAMQVVTMGKSTYDYQEWEYKKIR